jgi:hypothetical protein
LSQVRGPMRSNGKLLAHLFLLSVLWLFAIRSDSFMLGSTKQHNGPCTPIMAESVMAADLESIGPPNKKLLARSLIHLQAWQ